MLNDRQRKILRIIANYSAGRRRFPTLHELKVKTGFREANIIFALNKLAEERYIEYEPPGQIKRLLESWERGPVKNNRFWS